MAPVWVIPILPPAATLFAVTVRLPPPALIVTAPSETMVDAAPPLPVIVTVLAVISPVIVTTVAVAVAVVCEPVMVITPPVIAPVSLMPAAVVVVVLIVIAWPVAVIVPELE